MKITSKQDPTLTEVGAGKTREKQSNASRKEGLAENKAESTLNTATQTMQRIREALASEPDVNVDRVKELKARIEKGEFKVDEEKLAGHMLTASLKEDVEES